MASKVWDILVVDDEKDIHSVTDLSLKRRTWRGRPFAMHSAYSADEARQLISEGSTLYHVAIVDVVMETLTAGLELCRYIRDTQPPSLRVILRTGQPGVAPEEQVLQDYDIDYYLTKADASEFKLYTVIRAALRTAEDISALERTNLELNQQASELKRLSALRTNMLSLVGDPDSGYLAELVGHANRLSEAKGLPPELQQSADAFSEAAKRLSDVLDANDYRSRAEVVLQRQSVLLHLSNPHVLAFAFDALVGTNAFIEATSTSEEALRRLSTVHWDLMYVDLDSKDLIAQGREKQQELHSTLLLDMDSLIEQLLTVLEFDVDALVASTGFSGEEASDPLTIQEIGVTAGKLLSGDLFGLEKYLAWGSSVREAPIEDLKSDIAGAVEQITTAATRRKLGPASISHIRRWVARLWERMAAAAPTPEKDTPTLRFGSDGNLFGISLMDRRGRLQGHATIARLIRSFHHPVGFTAGRQSSPNIAEADDANIATYGAPATLIYNTDRGDKAEVILLFDRWPATGGQLSRPRSVHLFKPRQ